MSQRSVLEHVVGFSRALHDAGLEVNPGSMIHLGECFAFIDLAERNDFYAAARATLVHRREDIALFDSVFAQYWEAPERVPIKRQKDEADDDDDAAPQESGARLTLPDDDGGSAEEGAKPLKLAYSPEEAFAERDLGTLTDGDIERAQRLIRQIVRALANRRSRRRQSRHHGEIPDLRRLLHSRALFLADGITPLTFRRRRIKRTRLLLICDVSGSMQRYSRFLIEFMYALRRELSDLEVAVFSTRLTVITDLLRKKGVAASIREVAGRIHDWAGGTNIGGSLREFNELHAPHMLNRRTAVILLSDGWDRGDAAEMRREMGRLRERARSLIWLNPLLGTPGYQPLTQGMQCALPFLDHFLPAHNLQSLARLTTTLRAVGA